MGINAHPSACMQVMVTDRYEQQPTLLFPRLYKSTLLWIVVDHYELELHQAAPSLPRSIVLNLCPVSAPRLSLRQCLIQITQRFPLLN